jgi:hypothetical protein
MSTLGALVYVWRRKAADAREVTMFALFVVMAAAYWVRNQIWFAPEARFLFPVFLPLIYGLGGAAMTLRHPRLAFLALLVFTLLPFAYLALV